MLFDILAWFMVGLLVLGTLTTISNIGKHRPPLTAGVVNVSIVITALNVGLLLYAVFNH